MGIADLSFKLHTNSGLTILASNPLQTTHESDLSDGSQDFHYYWGSNSVNTQLNASSDPGVDDIILTPAYVLPEWQAANEYALGDSVIPTSANGYRYEVTSVSGSAPYTSHATTEPTWPTTLGATVVDNELTWTLVAEDSPTSEIILALTEAELDTNTPGAALTIGPSIDSGVLNAVEIWIRLTNTITQVSDSYGTPELAIVPNGLVELPV